MWKIKNKLNLCDVLHSIDNLPPICVDVYAKLNVNVVSRRSFIHVMIMQAKHFVVVDYKKFIM